MSRRPTLGGGFVLALWLAGAAVLAQPPPAAPAAAPTAPAQPTLADLKAKLKTATDERAEVQRQFDALTPTVADAKQSLAKLRRDQAADDQVAAAEDRVDQLETEKLRLLTELLRVQEERAKVLGDIEDFETAAAQPPPAPPPAPGAEAPAPPVDPGADELAAKRQDDEDLRTAQSEKHQRLTTTRQFQREMEALTNEQQTLEAQQRYNLMKRDGADKGMEKAKLYGTKGEVDYNKREYDAWSAHEVETAKRLDDVRRKLMALKREFESYIADEASRDVILPGETIELFVAEDKTMNGLYTVRRGGYIILPRVGRVLVAGKPMLDAEKVIKKELEATQLQVASVMLERPDAEPGAKTGMTAETGGATIYLTGAFKTPGPWSVPMNFKPTLVTAIIRSGGVTADADLENARVMRVIGGKGMSEAVDVRAVMDGDELVSDLDLTDGDIVIVPFKKKEGKKVVFVTGNIKTPGQVELKEDKKLTAYSAMLEAGGPTRFAALGDCYILRGNGDGKKRRIEVNVKAIRKGQAPDPELQADDILVVPESFWGTGF